MFVLSPWPYSSTFWFEYLCFPIRIKFDEGGDSVLYGYIPSTFDTVVNECTINTAVCWVIRDG